MSEETLPFQAEAQRRKWFLLGARGAFSLPGAILVTSFVGFAALARDAGITAAQAVFMTGVVWALPSKVVFIGAIVAGASLPAVALAVALSAIRLMPMAIALTPELRDRDTPRWVLYALSHFVAVTSWVLALEKLADVPRPMRTTYYAGLGSTLVLVNMGVVAAVYALADAMPPIVSAALLMLTPMYFLTSLWSSARERAVHVAMALGLVLGPLFHLVMPGFDLLAAGFAAGGLAYGFHRLRRRTPA